MFRNLPSEILEFKTLKYLPVETIMFLCRTNQEYSEFCNNNKLWIYLLKRDYKLNYNNDDAMNHYINVYTFRKKTDVKISDLPNNGIYISTKIPIVLRCIDYVLDGPVYKYRPIVEDYFERLIIDYGIFMHYVFVDDFSSRSVHKVPKKIKRILPKIFDIQAYSKNGHDMIKIEVRWNVLRYAHDAYRDEDFMGIFVNKVNESNLNDIQKIALIKQIEKASSEPLLI